jgi:hypothetical protein
MAKLKVVMSYHHMEPYAHKVSGYPSWVTMSGPRSSRHTLMVDGWESKSLSYYSHPPHTHSTVSLWSKLGKGVGAPLVVGPKIKKETNRNQGCESSSNASRKGVVESKIKL